VSQNNDLLQFAVIGCGALARGQHIPNLVRSKKAALHTCCDLSEAALELCVDTWGVPNTSTDWQETVRSPEVDAIVLATTEKLRLPVIRLAAELGKPIYVEKPIAKDLETLYEIQSAVHDAGIPFCAGHNRRNAPAMIDARAIFRRHMERPAACPWRWDREPELRPALPEDGVASFSCRINDDWYSWKAWVFDKSQAPHGPMLFEMTHFTEGQFWYMVSRNRDPSGTVKPYIRGTCNPDPDSFVATLIDWWIDPTTGLAIPERSGIVRFFIRYHDDLVWADTPEELQERYPGSLPKSLTFIGSSYKDNQLGMAADPGYLANLENLPRVERERLKTGNWKVRAAAGDYFKASDFPIIERRPDNAAWVRYWDGAATEPNANNKDPDWTVGCLIGRDPQGNYCVAHIDRFRRRLPVARKYRYNSPGTYSSC